MLTMGCPETTEDWIQLRWEAHYYKAQHSKSLEREKVLKAKVLELGLTLEHQEVQIKELIAGFQKTIAQETSSANEVGRLKTFPYEVSVVRKVFYTFLYHKKIAFGDNFWRFSQSLRKLYNFLRGGETGGRIGGGCYPRFPSALSDKFLIVKNCVIARSVFCDEVPP